ncbi:MAG: ABC transporter substrate-binding protein [Aristaeellaceae bacterium]
MKKLVSLLLALALVLCAVSAIADGSMTILSTEPNTLNWTKSQSNLDADVFYLINCYLYRPYNGTSYAEAAEGYTVSDDGLVYTYTIKDGLTYTDGTPITADDFAYGLLTKLALDSTASYYLNGEAYVNGEADESAVGIKALDDKTLQITLAEYSAEFDPELAACPLNREFVAAQGDALGGTPANLMYSGPYVLTEWVYGSYLTFEKNPAYIYADNSFPISQVKLLSSSAGSASTAYTMFVTGEVDVIRSAKTELVELVGEQYAHHYDSSAMQMLEFNTTGFSFVDNTFQPRDAAVTALLANKNFRLALSWALNREAIVGAVNESGAPSSRYFGSTCLGSEEGTRFIDEYPVDCVPLTGDEAKAKEYLAAALTELGYASVDELPTVKYLTFDSEMYRLMAETLQSEWKRVLGISNIEIELQPIQSAIMSMVFMNYDIYYQSLSCSPDAMIGALKYWITGGSVSDVMGAHAPFSSIYSNAEFDAIVAAVQREPDRNARLAMLAQAEQLIVEDAIILPIQYNGGYYIVNDRVHDYVYVDSQDGIMINYATVD